MNYEKAVLSLYKFRVLGNISHEEILTSNMLSFPSPNNFNDPFDCAIPIHYGHGTKKEITHYWEEHLTKSRPDLNRKERKESAINIYNEIRKGEERTLKIQEGIILDTIGVFSLSGNYKSILLWSHYANSHRGFCVGLNVMKLKRFCQKEYVEQQEVISLEEVGYQDKYPVINAYRMSNDERLKCQLLTKSPEWGYEKEYRLIWFMGSNRKLKIDDGIIRRVILGCKMIPNDKDKIISILKARKDKVHLYQAIRKQDSFGLEFKLIKY